MEGTTAAHRDQEIITARPTRAGTLSSQRLREYGSVNQYDVEAAACRLPLAQHDIFVKWQVERVSRNDRCRHTKSAASEGAQLPEERDVGDLSRHRSRFAGMR